MRHLLPLLLVFAIAALGCGKSEATCETACDNLDACGKYNGTRVDCIVQCAEDPDMDESALRCLTDSSCREIEACIPGSATPDQCAAMCDKVYDQCGRSLLDRAGNQLGKGDCLVTCIANGDARSAQCYVETPCENMSVCG